MAEIVQVYARGLLMCSACAPAEMDGPAVAAAVSRDHPSGTELGWAIAKEPFRDGEPNPCPCNVDAARRHWLLEC
ncbi:hypothetical protein [Methylobacterium gnaphalii]|uniref:Uncharacterized protein n=1 Tax=Methylobacterium gnaphalii TaxID=1010610 RepID=A0A512JQQ2_9HYPH|nr:hypothetical protein [Methylobacterium gnaphalii]GEP12290.1 hypothetical protein MGN01_41350 [Methylobacterium gnaphalii]GJD68706.1 hypothetical protein MMMDOFMJ_1630 [Methylobacterium gnaphalii]GLS49397.1 hypothetical protein GCM10007885_22450 [Methylobacterium gnaphalii]